MLRSRPVPGSDRDRGLVVLADGAQTGFAAGAVAGLASRGRSWSAAWGAGLGAQVALLALLGEADEAARRWQRWAEGGAGIVRPRVQAAREAVSGIDGVRAVLDPWRLDGWLDERELRDHLLPESADLPGRLGRRGARCWVSIVDLAAGAGGVVEIGSLGAEAAGEAVVAAGRFAGGWGPDGEARWGGVAAAAAAWPPALAALPLDVVCGFPVPPVRRAIGAASLFELVQRRDEITAATSVMREAAARSPEATRIVAPSQSEYLAWADRDGAELGAEYPLPWEHNGALLGGVIAFGRHCGAAGPATDG